jgi:hypothetical protein
MFSFQIIHNAEEDRWNDVVAERMRQRRQAFMARDARVAAELGSVHSRLSTLSDLCDRVEYINIARCFCFKQLATKRKR